MYGGVRPGTCCDRREPSAKASSTIVKDCVSPILGTGPEKAKVDVNLTGELAIGPALV